MADGFKWRFDSMFMSWLNEYDTREEAQKAINYWGDSQSFYKIVKKKSWVGNKKIYKIVYND